MNADLIWYLRNNLLLLILGCIIAFPVYPWLKGKLAVCINKGYGLMRYKAAAVALSVALIAAYLGLFFLTTAYLVNDTYNPFLYFRF